MSIATKNGSLMLKDGKLAESCGCCGGCSADSLRAAYDRLRSASCSVSLAGNLPRQDAGVSFTPSYGVTISSPVSAVSGTWTKWDAWECPATLPLALAASTFQQDSPLGTHNAWMRFRGATQPDTPLATDRLWVQADIFLYGLPSGASSPPAAAYGNWSLLPGSSGCWVRSSAWVKARSSHYLDTRGVLSANVVNLGPVYSVNGQSYNVYPWTTGAPFYSSSTSTVRSAVSFSTSSPTQSFWNYSRSLDIEEKSGFAPFGRNVDGEESGVIYTDNAVIASNDTSFSIPMSLFNRGNSNLTPDNAFHTWKQNDAPLSSSQWVSNIRSPQATSIDNVLHVEWDRDVATQKYGPTDFGNNWLTLATLTLT